jgi:hypothetical protein
MANNPTLIEGTPEWLEAQIHHFGHHIHIDWK